MRWVLNAIEELLPVVTFVALQQLVSFTAGLAVMTALVVCLLALAYATGRKPPRFAVASNIALLAFTIPSIVTGDNDWFQVSDTLIDGFVALLLLGSWAVNYPLLKVLFDRVFAITDEAWRILSLRWGLLLLVLACLNEIVRRGYSEDAWTWYKLASTVLILAFGCYQFTLSARMRIPEESNRLGLRR